MLDYPNHPSRVADIELMQARALLYSASQTNASTAYLREHDLDPLELMGFAGAMGCLPIIEIGNGRFSIARKGEIEAGPFTAFVIEALDADGETPIDLVAWPLDSPERHLTLFGTADMVGLWAAHNPASYIFDSALELHRTSLGWLQSGCTGAAVIIPNLAAHRLLRLPGNIAVQDQAHGREIHAMIARLFDPSRIVCKKAQIEQVAA